MRKFLATLLLAAVCVCVFGEAHAQNRVSAVLVKKAKWGTWTNTGIADTPKDTTNLVGSSATDTTTAFWIGDYNCQSGGVLYGSGAVTAFQGMKIFVYSNGKMDDVDSLYYRIEQSPDGVHWGTPAASASLTTEGGVLAGFDQGGVVANPSGNCAIINAKFDFDAVDGVSATGATHNTLWAWSPYIRIILRNDAAGGSPAIHGCQLAIAYPGWREQSNQ